MKLTHKLFIFLNIILLIIVVVIIANLTYLSVNIGYKDIIEQHVGKIIHSQMNYVDKIVADNVFGFIDKNFFKYDNLTEVSTFFTHDDSDLEFLGKINVQLYELRKTNPVVSEIILYRTYDKAVISDRRGRYLNFENSEWGFNNVDDIIRVFDLFFFSENMDKIRIINMDNDRISFLFPYLGSNSSGDKFIGFIIVYANKDVIFDVEMLIDNPRSAFMVMDDEYNVIYSKGNNIFSDEIIKETIEKFPEDDSLFIHRKFNNNVFSFTYMKSKVSDWIYVYYSPQKDIFESFLLRNKILKSADVKAICNIILICIALLILLYDYRYYKKNAHVFKKLTQNLSKTDYPAWMHDNQKLEKYSAFMDLVYGKLSPEETEKVLAYFAEGKKLYPYYLIVVISIDPETIKEQDKADKSELKSQYIEYIYRYFHEKSINAINVIEHQDNIYCLINQKDNYINKILYIDMLNNIESTFNIKCNIFISSCTDHNNQLPYLYNEVNKAFRYTYIYNYSNVFTSTDINNFDNNSMNLGNDFDSYITSLINLEKYDELKEYILQKTDEIRKHSLSYDYTQYILMRIIRCISNSYLDKNINSETENMTSIIENFNKIQSLDQCIEWIIQCIDKYAEYMNNRKLFINKEYIDSIIEYIRANPGSASLSSVAEHFHISVSHLSRMFKTHTSMNFSEYVTNCKLEKALEILKTEENVTIVEIAKRLGYETPSYFTRIFKEKYNITPVMYRKRYFASLNSINGESQKSKAN